MTRLLLIGSPFFPQNPLVAVQVRASENFAGTTMNTFDFFIVVAFFVPVAVHCRVRDLGGMYYRLFLIISIAEILSFVNLSHSLASFMQRIEKHD